MLVAAMVEVWQELDMPLCRALVAEWSLRQQALFDRQFKLPHSWPSQESWRRRILRIVSLPDFVEHSLTHREEIGDNGNAGRRIRTTKTWAAALLSLRALDRRVV